MNYSAGEITFYLSLSEECSFEFGPGVFYARSVSQSPYDINDDCQIQMQGNNSGPKNQSLKITPSISNNATYEIYNLQGVKISTGSIQPDQIYNQANDISSFHGKALPAGIYLLKIDLNGQKQVFKILHQ